MPKIARAVGLGPSQGRFAAVAADSAGPMQVLPMGVAPRVKAKSTVPPLLAPGLLRTQPGAGNFPFTRATLLAEKFASRRH